MSRLGRAGLPDLHPPGHLDRQVELHAVHQARRFLLRVSTAGPSRAPGSAARRASGPPRSTLTCAASVPTKEGRPVERAGFRSARLEERAAELDLPGSRGLELVGVDKPEVLEVCFEVQRGSSQRPEPRIPLALSFCFLPVNNCSAVDTERDSRLASRPGVSPCSYATSMVGSSSAAPVRSSPPVALAAQMVRRSSRRP